MNLSENGKRFIKQLEGCALKAYPDASGYSIGYGHYGVAKNAIITQREADRLFDCDISYFESVVDAYRKKYKSFTQNEYDALVSFTYNCGSGCLKTLTNNGKRTKAQIADALLRYVYSDGVVNKGLVSRRRKERLLFLGLLVTESSFYPSYTGVSTHIDEIMTAIGAAKDYDKSADKPYKKRIPIAKANGIKNYCGTYEQNTLLYNLAVKGQLRKVAK